MHLCVEVCVCVFLYIISLILFYHDNVGLCGHSLKGESQTIMRLIVIEARARESFSFFDSLKSDGLVSVFWLKTKNSHKNKKAKSKFSRKVFLYIFFAN